MILAVPAARRGDAPRSVLRQAGRSLFRIGQVVAQKRGAAAGGVPMKRLGILLSGRGSNFEAIADNVAAGRSDAEIAVVIGNRPEARGLEGRASAG